MSALTSAETFWFKEGLDWEAATPAEKPIGNSAGVPAHWQSRNSVPAAGMLKPRCGGLSAWPLGVTSPRVE